MARGDFIRQMPESARDFGRKPTLYERLHIDLPLLAILFALCVYGLVVLYSASGRQVDAVLRQGGFMVLGFAAMFAVAQLDTQTLRRWTPWAYLLGVLLLVAVDVAGIGAKGAQRWLAIPGLPRFQPSEIMKLVMPMMVASFLAATVLPPRFLHVCITLAIVAVPTALVLVQPDLGTAVLITAAAGDGASLARLIAGVAPVCETILYAAPEDAAVDLAALLPDHTVRRTVLYRMAPARSLPAEALAALDDGTILAALFYSVRTAQHFGQLVSQANRLPALQGVAALCLSEPIAATARALPFSAARAAVRPDEAALFDLLEALRAEG